MNGTVEKLILVQRCGYIFDRDVVTGLGIDETLQHQIYTRFVTILIYKETPGRNRGNSVII